MEKLYYNIALIRLVIAFPIEAKVHNRVSLNIATINFKNIDTSITEKKSKHTFFIVNGNIYTTTPKFAKHPPPLFYLILIK